VCWWCQSQVAYLDKLRVLVRKDDIAIFISIAILILQARQMNPCSSPKGNTL